MDEDDLFEEGPDIEAPEAVDAFVVDLEGYEGPIDALLIMARDQKVDLTQISILALADQYLEFVAEARRRNLELAADYLVMAAWLAYLKSKLLLPDLDADEEPTGAEMAAALRYQLRRLNAMQDAGKKLMTSRRLGIDFFGRGQPEAFRARVTTFMELSLFELLKAYGDQRRHKAGMGPLTIEPFEVYTVDDAIARIRRLLGSSPDWQNLWSYLPKGLQDGLLTRSAVASTFAASLELAKEGRAVVRQAETYGPLFLRSRPGGNRPANDESGPVSDKPETDA